MSAKKSFDNASLDLVQLNNVIVSLRSTTKKAKLFVFRKLKRRNDLLMKKKDRKTAERKQKSINLEINLLKKWNVDMITKAALANEIDLEKGLHGHNCEKRLLSKLCNVPCLRNRINSFRSRHSDWKDLTSFLMYKNTGGKFKTKKEAHGPLPHIDEDDTDLLSIGSLSEDDISFDERSTCTSNLNEKGVVDEENKNTSTLEFDSPFHTSLDNADGITNKTLDDMSTNLGTDNSFKSKIGAGSSDSKMISKANRGDKIKKRNASQNSASRQKKNSHLFEPLNVTDVLLSNNNLDTIRARLMGDAMFVETDDGSTRVKEKKQEHVMKDRPVIQRKVVRTASGKGKAVHDKGTQDKYARSIDHNAHRNGGQIVKAKTEEDIHPSWSAKLKEKEKMLAFKTNKATKIVFDDSD